MGRGAAIVGSRSPGVGRMLLRLEWALRPPWLRAVLSRPQEEEELTLPLESSPHSSERSPSGWVFHPLLMLGSTDMRWSWKADW